jgi:hypothetical protein
MENILLGRLFKRWFGSPAGTVVLAYRRWCLTGRMPALYYRRADVVREENRDDEVEDLL